MYFIWFGSPEPLRGCQNDSGTLQVEHTRPKLPFGRPSGRRSWASLGGLPEHLEGLLGTSWGHFGGSWNPLGTLWTAPAAIRKTESKPCILGGFRAQEVHTWIRRGILLQIHLYRALHISSMDVKSSKSYKCKCYCTKKIRLY